MAVGSLANWCDLVEAAKYHQQEIRKEQQQASTVWGQISSAKTGDTLDLLVRTLSWGEKTLLDNWAGGGNWSSYC